MNNKGQMTDLFAFGAIIMVFALAAIFGLILLNEFESGFTTNPTLNTTVGQNAIDKGHIVFAGFDIASLIILTALFIFVIISAFFIQSHPAFFVISLIIFIIAVGVAGIFEHVYSQIEIAEGIEDTADEFPIISWLFSNWPVIIAVIGALVMIVLHGKPRRGEGI